MLKPAKNAKSKKPAPRVKNLAPRVQPKGGILIGMLLPAVQAAREAAR
jgi:hypothetical protein